MVKNSWVLGVLSFFSYHRLSNLVKPLSPEETSLVEHYRTLSEADQIAVHLLLNALKKMSTF